MGKNWIEKWMGYILGLAMHKNGSFPLDMVLLPFPSSHGSIDGSQFLNHQTRAEAAREA